MRRRPFSVLFALALLAGIPSGPAAAAAAIEWTFDAPPAEGEFLANMLILGSEGAWAGEVSDGRYHLYNTSAPASLKYFYAGINRGGEPVDLSDATVSVELEANFGNRDAGAGILYRYDAAASRYLVFLLTGGGYAVWVSNGGGISKAISGTLENGPISGPVTLTVRGGENGTAEFLVDGAVAAAMAVDGVNGPEVGFAALGLGEFSFDNFRVYEAGQAPSAEPEVAEPEVVEPPSDNGSADAGGTPPPLPAAQYFVAENGQPVGPLTLAEVTERIASGSVGAGTLIWVAGTPDWVAASTLPELAEALGR